MSGTLPAHEPACLDDGAPSIELLLEARPRDIGGFSVSRVLPSARRRLVGPFIFFDHFGPAQLPVGHRHGRAAAPAHRAGDRHLPVRGGDHPPRQPGIGAADPPGRRELDGGRSRASSIPSAAATERPAQRRPPARASSAGSPCRSAARGDRAELRQHPAATHPAASARRASVLDVLAGPAYGARSPVAVLRRRCTSHAHDGGGRAAAIVDLLRGARRVCGGRRHRAATSGPSRRDDGRAATRRRHARRARGQRASGRRGGGPLAARHIWWNFVSSSPARIAQAKARLARAPRFPKVPGDERGVHPAAGGLIPPRLTARALGGGRRAGSAGFRGCWRRSPRWRG